MLLSLGAGAALLRMVASDIKRGQLPRERALSRTALIVMSLALCGAGLIATYSRAGIAGAVLVSFVSFVSVGRAIGTRTILGWTLAIIVITIGTCVVSGVSSELLADTIGSLTRSDGYIKIRILSQHLERIADAPLIGIGRGSSTEILAMTTRVPQGMTVTHIESIPILLAVEYGVAVGVAAVGLIVAWVVMVLPSLRGAQRIALATVIAVLLQNGVDFSLEFLGAAAPATALMAILTPTRKIRIAPATARRISMGVILLLLTLLAGAWVTGGGWATARARSAAPCTVQPPRSRRSTPPSASAPTMRDFTRSSHIGCYSPGTPRPPGTPPAGPPSSNLTRVRRISCSPRRSRTSETPRALTPRTQTL